MWQALRQKDAWDDIWAETWGNLGKHVITPNVSSEYKILCLAYSGAAEQILSRGAPNNKKNDILWIFKNFTL